MATKAELEADFHAYQNLFRRAKAQAGVDIAAAIETACLSWPHVDGMLQYARKYEQQNSPNPDAIWFVLKNAPLRLDAKPLDRLDALIKTSRRLARTDAADGLVQARDLLKITHRLLNHLERNGEVRQDELRRNLGGDQDCLRAIAEAWEGMGFIQRTPMANSYILSLHTRMDAATRGKCPSCGATVKAPKAKLLEAQECPKCRRVVEFVLL